MFLLRRETTARSVATGLLFVALSFLIGANVRPGPGTSLGLVEAAGGPDMDAGPGMGVADQVRSAIFAGEGLRLTAYFSNGKVRLAFSDGREMVLDQAISASGARYTDGETLFWNKGDDAFIEWEGVSHTVRVVDPSVDVWERARRAGVDFRGIGQEPGWLIEIRDGESIHLRLDYDTTQITTPISGLHTDYATGTRTFAATPPLSPLHVTVTVSERVCYDAMSGEGFTSTVAVELGGTGAAYYGCGRDL